MNYRKKCFKVTLPGDFLKTSFVILHAEKLGYWREDGAPYNFKTDYMYLWDDGEILFGNEDPEEAVFEPITYGDLLELTLEQTFNEPAQVFERISFGGQQFIGKGYIYLMGEKIGYSDGEQIFWRTNFDNLKKLISIAENALVGCIEDLNWDEDNEDLKFVLEMKKSCE